MKKLEDYKVEPIFPMAPVSDPQLNSHETKVLFTYSEVDMEEDSYRSHIWVQDLRRKRPVQYTYGRSNEFYPRWSPSGNQLLFLSNRLGAKDKPDEKVKPQLFVMNASGGEARKVTYLDEPVMNPKWRPDGRAVAFISPVFKGEKANEESDVKIIRRIRYKFDGKGFFEGKYNHLFTVPVKGGKVKQVTDGKYDVGAYTWSPDGIKVAFVANLNKDADTSDFKNIYMVSSKGGEPELFWTGEGSIGDIAWSPDGKYIAFTGDIITDPELNFYRNKEVFLIPAEGGKPVCLTGDLDRTVRGSLTWGKDSKGVYFMIPDMGSTQVCTSSLDGSVSRVTEGKKMIGSYSVGVEQLVFSASSEDTPSELWVNDENITELNKTLLKKLDWAKPEEYWFTASDGVKVHGWILKPHEYTSGEKHPMVLEVHGGPRGQYGYTMDAATHEFQVLAANGYAVMYMNPRGSVGYGEEFSSVISGHWGERDYLDCMEAVDHIVKTYDFVDGSRLGIAGGSYGGYMTNWVIGHTDRFSAAVTMRSISNWYSMWGTSDIAFMDKDITWNKYPWENLEEVMAKSPITYMGNVKTPTMIIHSEQDHRCHMEQDEQLFTALMKLGVPTEFIRFPDEPHGLSRTGKPKHRVERLQHIVRWFDRYLKEVD